MVLWSIILFDDRFLLPSGIIFVALLIHNFRIKTLICHIYVKKQIPKLMVGVPSYH